MRDQRGEFNHDILDYSSNSFGQRAHTTIVVSHVLLNDKLVTGCVATSLRGCRAPSLRGCRLKTGLWFRASRSSGTPAGVEIECRECVENARCVRLGPGHRTAAPATPALIMTMNWPHPGVMRKCTPQISQPLCDAGGVFQSPGDSAGSFQPPRDTAGSFQNSSRSGFGGGERQSRVHDVDKAVGKPKECMRGI
jgi:hypothetical protein